MLCYLRMVVCVCICVCVMRNGFEITQSYIHAGMYVRVCMYIVRSLQAVM